MSQRRHGQQGFSLIEVLIVLAVLALAGLMFLPQLAAGRAELVEVAWARALANDLRELRSQAIRRNRPLWLQVTADGGGYVTALDTGRRLPAGLILRRLDAAGSEPIRFLPNGRSSGAVLRLQQASSSLIRVAWLTGAVTVEGGGS